MSTTAPQLKPVSTPPESVPVPTAPKPTEAVPVDLDSALAAALGTDVDKPTPVDPDKAVADLKKRFSGQEPADYVSDQIGSHIVDINAIRTDPQRLIEETERFNGRGADDYVIRNRISDVASSVMQTVNKARQQQVDLHDSQVQSLLIKELEHDALQNLEVQNAVAAGSVTLAELTQYTFFQTMLVQNPPGTAIRFPENEQHRKIHEAYPNDMWEKILTGDSDKVKQTERLAKEGRADQQQLLDEVNLIREWDGLDPAKQREVIEYAAGRSLDRIGQLGDRLLRDRQPVGLVLLTISGRISGDHIPLVNALPQGKELLQKFADIRKGGGDVILADVDYERRGFPDTVNLDPGLKINTLKIGPGNDKTQFAPYTKGPVYIVEQMMGMKPLDPIPQRAL